MFPHRILIDEKAIRTRVAELAKAIATDLPVRQPILLGLLTGSFIFLADLVRQLSLCGIDPKIEFIKVSHYGHGKESNRPVRFLKQEKLNLQDEYVLVVDDIFDSGHSMNAVVDKLMQAKPAWLRLCTLLDKPSRHQVSLQVDYIGFEIPDHWIIGYGLDLNEEGRALPYVASVEQTTDRGGGEISE